MRTNDELPDTIPFDKLRQGLPQSPWEERGGSTIHNGSPVNPAPSAPTVTRLATQLRQRPLYSQEALQLPPGWRFVLRNLFPAAGKPAPYAGRVPNLPYPVT